MDNTNLQDLWRSRKQAADEARRILDKAEREHRGLTSAEKRKVDALIEEGEQYEDAIDERMNDGDSDEPRAGRTAFKDVETRARLGGRAPTVHETRSGTMRNDDTMRHFDRDEYDAFDHWIRTGEVSAELRTADQSSTSVAGGGAVQFTGFRESLFDVIQGSGGLRDANVTVLQTDHGRDMKAPGIDDADETAEIVSPGSTAAGSTDDALDFFSVDWTAFTYRNQPVTITFEQRDDMQLDLPSIVTRKLGERINKAINDDFAVGAGSSEPEGLVNASTGIVTMGAGSSNLSLGLLRDLYFGTDPAWRDEGEWFVSDDAFQSILELSDADNRPFLTGDVTEEDPMRLFGRPIRRVIELPSIDASSNKPVLFGAARAFGLRDVRDVRIQRFDEKYAHRGRIGFMAWSRHDSRLQYSTTVASTVVPIQALLTT